MFVLHRQVTVIARLSLLIAEAESRFPSSVAEAVRRGGRIYLCAVTGRGGRLAAACVPGRIKPCSRRSGRIYPIAITGWAARQRLGDLPRGKNNAANRAE